MISPSSRISETLILHAAPGRKIEADLTGPLHELRKRRVGLAEGKVVRERIGQAGGVCQQVPNRRRAFGASRYSGRYSLTRSFSPIRPCSTSCSTPIATTGFVSDAMTNRSSG